jgi:anti-sigma B factor antagonist
MSDGTIECWFSDGIAWIKPSGFAGAGSTGQMKDFVRKMLKQGNRDFAVDLSECSGMDEVFMGSMAGMGLRVWETKTGSVKAVSAPTFLEEQFRSLGLDQLIQF